MSTLSTRPGLDRAVDLASPLLGLVAGALLWNRIGIPLGDDLGILGPLTQLRFNPVNNLIRFSVFVTLPAAFYLLSRAALGRVRKKTATGLEARRQDRVPTADRAADRAHRAAYRTVAALLIAWGLLGLRDFISGSFPLEPLDFFHEGETLDPAMNYVTRGGLWSSSFFIHGAFYDPLTSVGGWKIFGAHSIGASRLARLLLGLLVPGSLALFLLSVMDSLKIARSRLDAVVTASLLGSAYFMTDGLQVLERRDVPVLLGLASLVIGLARGRWLWFAVAGLIGPLCFFYAIDRGAYYTASCILVLSFHTAFLRDRRPIPQALLAWLGGALLGFGIFASWVGFTEWRAFVSTTFDIYRFKDLLDSFVYPSPLDPVHWRTHALPMVLIAIQGAAFVHRAPLYLRERRAVEGGIHVLFASLAFCYFRSSLGRSDDWHVMYGSSFAFLGTAYAVSIWAWRAPERWKLGLAAFALLPLSLSVLSGLQEVKRAAGFAGAGFGERISSFAKLPDEKFLPLETKLTLAELRAEFAAEPCVFVFPGDGSWNYLMAKPSCSRFVETWFAAPTSHQEELIRDLERAHPALILYDSPRWPSKIDGIKHTVRLSRVDRYVRDHYRFHRNIGSHLIYARSDHAPAAPEAPAAFAEARAGKSGKLRFSIEESNWAGSSLEIRGSGWIQGIPGEEQERLLLLKGTRGDLITVRPVPYGSGDGDVRGGFHAMLDARQLSSGRYQVGLWARNGGFEEAGFSDVWVGPLPAPDHLHELGAKPVAVARKTRRK